MVLIGANSIHELADKFRKNYFAVFNLPARYDLDSNELRRAFLGLARAVHPDRFAGESSDAIAVSQQLAAQLNVAYQALSDPVRRAEYLLELAGGASAEEDKTVPQAVLMQTLMMREEIEEAKAVGDAATLAGLRQQVRRQRDDALNEIAQLARRLPSGDEPTRKTLREKLNIMKYYDNLLGQL